MAKFHLQHPTAKGKSWKATGINPVTGRKLTVHGGQFGVIAGSANPFSQQTFDARHDVGGITLKKYINKLRWADKAKIGDTIDVPDELFESYRYKNKRDISF